MTRMWMLPPAQLCRQHLLGEHAEIHQLVGFIESDRDFSAKLNGHAKRGQIETAAIQARHDQLAAELVARDYNHDSPLEYDDELDLGEVDIAASAFDLRVRCGDCRARMEVAA